MTSGKWQSSNRRRELPPDWPKLRKACAVRAGWQCEWVLPDGRRCTTLGSEADHYGDKDDHSRLRWLCTAHHKVDTQRRAQEAKRKYAEPLRAPEPHPGRPRR